MDAVVSRALPVASTTGMSVFVPLPGTTMLVLFISPNEQLAPLIRGNQKGKTQGRLVWGAGFFPLHLNFPPGPQLIALSLMMVSKRERTISSRACWRGWIPSLWHQDSLSSVLQHPIFILHPFLGLNPCLHKEKTSVVFIDLQLCFQLSTKPVVDS